MKKYHFAFSFKDNQACWCSEVSCNECMFHMNHPRDCNKVKMEWLYQEHKEPIVLTEDEKSLCKLLDRGYIVRYKDNRLFWSDIKPIKDEYDMWNFKDCKEFHNISLGMYPNCKFDFIKWEDEEPWEVKIDD